MNLNLKYKIIYQKNFFCIKGEYAIKSYENNLIVLKCDKDNIFLNGSDFYIRLLLSDEIHIVGKFSSISFC